MSLVLVTREDDRQSLMHYRTKGSKNGVRRFQNPDGTLTPEGQRHYAEMYDWGNGNKAAAPSQMQIQRTQGPQRMVGTVRSVNGGPASSARAATTTRQPQASGNRAVAVVRTQNLGAANSSNAGKARTEATNGQQQVVVNRKPTTQAQTPAQAPQVKSKIVSITRQPSKPATSPANSQNAGKDQMAPINGQKPNQAVGQQNVKTKQGSTSGGASGFDNKTGELTDKNGKPIGETTKDGKYYGKGNIDLNSRWVVNNKDGSISTERSFSVNIDGKETLLPTVINGTVVDEDTAINYYMKTGEHLGQFDTVEEAEEYAETLHNRQNWYYNQRNSIKHSSNYEDYLMHHRTFGSKNGVRRFQNKDGSLTPEGYQHYKEMYGWGEKKKKNATIDEDEYKSIRKSASADDADYKKEKKAALSTRGAEHEKLSAKSYYKQLDAGRSRSRAVLEKNAGHGLRFKFFTKQAKKEERDAKKLENQARLSKLGNMSNKEIREQVKEKINSLNEKAKNGAAERTKADNDRNKEIKDLTTENTTKANPDKEAEKERKGLIAVKKQQLKEKTETIRNIRNMSDEDLNKALNRLRMEKQYAELLNERANREKGPIAAMASDLFKNAAQDLAKKALSVAVDKVIDKAKSSTGFKLADYKDVDPYSLPSDKLKAVAQAFNDAANLSRNRNVVNNGGYDNNQNNQNNQNNGNQQKGQQNNQQQQKKGNQPNGQANGNNQPNPGTQQNGQQNNQSNSGNQNSQSNSNNSRNSQSNSGNQNSGNNQQNGQSNSGNQSGGNNQGNGGQVSKNQQKKMRSMARSGASAADIAQQLGVSESTVQQYAGDQLNSSQTSSGSNADSGNGNSQGSSPANDGGSASKTTPSNYSELSSKYRDVAASGRIANQKKMQNNLKINNRNIKRANNFFDSLPERMTRADLERTKEERLQRYTEWVNGAEWEKMKPQLQAEGDAARAKAHEDYLKFKAHSGFGYRW